MTQTPAAGWFVDPEDPTLLRYWDGAAWTEHRSPRGASTTDQLSKAGADLADGLARGFSAVGRWVDQNVGTPGTPQHPTFASVAASCREEPARTPLSVAAELVQTPVEQSSVAALLGVVAVRPDQPVRLVPNPWDPAVPNGVAVFVAATMVGRLPAELEAAYCGPLAQLASRSVLATAAADLRPDGVTVRLPELGALS